LNEHIHFAIKANDHYIRVYEVFLCCICLLNLYTFTYNTSIFLLMYFLSLHFLSFLQYKANLKI